MARCKAKVTTHNGGLRQQRRLQHIWEAAGQSIGCRPGPAMAMESELLVDTLKSIKEQLDDAGKDRCQDAGDCLDVDETKGGLQPSPHSSLERCYPLRRESPCNCVEAPDNCNDQARAHLQARESAEEGIRKATGEVLPKIRDILNPS